MKFYDCLTAPSPRRVRMLIAEKGIQVETVQVDLARGEQLSEAFGRINPRRTVPVLELDDGTRLLDSNSISLYLDEVFPEPNLTGRGAKERAIIAMWQRDMDLNGLEAVAECFRNSAKGLRNRALTGAVDYEQIPALAERDRLRVRQFYNVGSVSSIARAAAFSRKPHLAQERWPRKKDVAVMTVLPPSVPSSSSPRKRIPPAPASLSASAVKPLESTAG